MSYGAKRTSEHRNQVEDSERLESFMDQSSGECYQLLENLGKGHQARVCKVRRKSDSKILAAKILFEKSDEESRKNLENEFRILSSLHHSSVINCVALFNYEEVSGKKGLIMTMDLCEGRTLKDWIDDPTNVRFAESEVLLIMHQILSAIHYLHERNIIHRDISFDNIIYDREKVKAMLVDFGLARSLSKE